MPTLKGLLLALFVLTATQQRTESQLGRSRFSDTEFSGSLAGFAKSPTEGIIVEIERSIVVREITGVLRSAGGEWPENTEILFEIRGPSPAKTVKGVVTDRKGKFSFGTVSPGSYSFKATANGWHSIVGTLIVSQGAKQKQIELTMRLGV